MIRSSTVAMLLSYHTGPRPLSDALRRYFVIKSIVLSIVIKIIVLIFVIKIPHHCHCAGLYQRILSALFCLSPTLRLSTGVDVMMWM